jgi:hypothetical protein
MPRVICDVAEERVGLRHSGDVEIADDLDHDDIGGELSGADREPPVRVRELIIRQSQSLDEDGAGPEGRSRSSSRTGRWRDCASLPGTREIVICSFFTVPRRDRAPSGCRRADTHSASRGAG